MDKKTKTFQDFFEGLKIYLFPVFVLGVILLLFNFLVKGKVEDLLQTRKEIATQRERLSRLIEKQTTLSALDEETLKRQFLFANEALPSKMEAAGFLAQVERAALESGLLIKGVSIEGGGIATQSGEKKDETRPAQKDRDWFTSKVEVEGKIDQVALLIKKLLESRRTVQISKLRLSFASSGAAVATSSATKASLTVDVFFKTLPESMGSTEEPLPQISSRENETYDRLSLYPLLSEPISFGGGLGVAATPGARVSPFGP